MKICQSCGSQNEDSAATCARCFAPLTDAAPAPPPPPPVGAAAVPPALPGPGPIPGATPAVPNYLVQSILVTVLCCLPLGVAAIIFSSQVNTKLAAGDYAGALESSKKAKMFCWIAVGLGFVSAIGWIIVSVFGAMIGASGQ